MKFEPKTDQELQEIEAANLIPSGIYDFEVAEAVDTYSKKGNPMAELKLAIVDNDGRERRVTDYLVATDAMAFKIKHFAESVGLLAEYQDGDLSAEIMRGRTGKCKIAVQPGKDGYRAKNTVADYIKQSSSDAPQAAAKSSGDTRPAAQPFDDNIPF